MRPLYLALAALRRCRTHVDNARHLWPVQPRTRSQLDIVVACLRDAEKHLKTALQLERDAPKNEGDARHG